MASVHLHSVKLESGYHHLFNIFFMTTNEIELVKLLLDGKPIPARSIDILNNLKKAITDSIEKSKKKDDNTINESIVHPMLSIKDGEYENLDGAEADGAEADGAEADGAEADGAEADGAEADGAEADGAEADD